MPQGAFRDLSFSDDQDAAVVAEKGAGEPLASERTGKAPQHHLPLARGYLFRILVNEQHVIGVDEALLKVGKLWSH